MQTNEIKEDIQQRIEIINGSFKVLLGNSYNDKYCVDDIHSLEKELSKISLQFRIYNILLIIFMSALLILFVWHLFKPEFKPNLWGLIGLFSVLFSARSSFYKLKVKLEDKIYLLKLTKKIE